MADYYTVANSFIGTLHKDEEVTYVAGEVVPASDPAFKKWPEHFVPLVVRGQVEQATAAPGEKRKLSLRRAKPRKATPAEEAGIAATVAAEAKAEPEAEPAGKPLTLGSFKPGG